MGFLIGTGNPLSAQRYAGIQVSTSIMGQPIPYVAGRNRISMNLLWYGDFQATGSGSSGKGGGPSSYNYSTAFIGGLCIGPIQGIYNVWLDRSVVNLSDENLSFALGSGGQATWTGYPSGTPAGQQIPYDHIAYVATNYYNLYSSPSMPNLTYEVEGVVPSYSAANGVYDADPSAVITDYLTDSVHGAIVGYPGTALTLGSSDAPLTGTSNSYQAYCMCMGLLTSPYEYTQRQATEFLAEHLECTNSGARLSVGVLEVIPFCDQAVSATVAGTSFSYTPNLTPEYSFSDDDYLAGNGEPPVQLQQTPQHSTFNEVNIEFLDRSNYYNPAPVNCSDLNDKAKYGVRLAPQKTWHAITQAAVAKTAGTLWLTRQLYEINKYVFKVRADYALLEVLDLIALTDANLGLSAQVCQILEIEEGFQDKIGDVLTITALELPGVTRSTAQYNWESAQGFFQNFDAAPGNVQAPVIFQMPPVAGALSEGITLGVAVCGQASEAFWGGCQVYCSVDGGSTYEWVGTIGPNGPARYGTLGASLSAVADPDTTSTLSVTLSDTNLQLSTAVTHTDADALQTLLLVGQGSSAEVLSYGAGALVSAGQYNLSYLRRGLYGSLDQAHASGDPFVRLDGSIFQVSMDPGMAGSTVYFKFCSYNTVGRALQSLASATAYSYTIPVANAVSGSSRLIPRGSCAVSADGRTVYKATTGANAWDSDAYSTQGYLNGCFISWRAAETTSASMTGLSTNPASTASYTKLNFGLYLNSGTVQIYELGAEIASYGSYAVGDAFEVRYDGVTVRYFHNGALIRAKRAPQLTLYPAVCIYHPGGVVSNVEFGPASAVNQPTGSLLNTYPWVVGSSGSQGNYEDNYDGTNEDSTIVLGGTTGNPLGPYGMSEALWKTTGAGSGANGGWNNDGDLYGIDSSKTYRSVVWLYWNGVGSPQLYHGADTSGNTCSVGTQTANSNPYFGPSGGGWLPSGLLAPNKWYLAVGLLHGSDYTGGSTGLSGIYDPATGQKITSGDVDWNILAGAPTQTQRVYQYYTNNAGCYIWFAKPRFEEVNGNEPSLQALMQPASAYQGWVTTGNTVQTGETFAKQGGTSTWDSTAYTVNGYSDCHISGKPNGTSQHAMIGLASSPASANLGGSIAYTPSGDFYNLYNSGGTWWYEEQGASASLGVSVATTDIAAITYDGSTVTYLINGTSVRTVSASGLTLHGFFAPYEAGSGFNSVEFGPTTNLAVVDTGQLGADAATALYEGSCSNTQSATQNYVNAISMTVGPFPFDTNVVFTMTGQWNWSYASGGSDLQYGISTSSSSFSNGSISQTFGSGTLSGGIAQETTFSLAANTTQTYYLNLLGGLQNAGEYPTVTATMKAEVIKR